MKSKESIPVANPTPITITMQLIVCPKVVKASIFVNLPKISPTKLNIWANKNHTESCANFYPSNNNLLFFFAPPFRPTSNLYLPSNLML